MTKRREERVKLQKTRQALDCGGSKQRRLRRERDERRRLLLLTCWDWRRLTDESERYREGWVNKPRILN